MLRRKSKWRSKNQRRTLKSPAAIAWRNQTLAIVRKQATERASATLLAEASEPALVPDRNAGKSLLRFRVTIECLTDGQRVQFTTVEGPHGLTVSPVKAGAKVACVLRNYRPQKSPHP